MFTPTEFTVRELDHRINDGIDVSLLWNSRTNQIAVAVRDERSGEAFEVCVAGARALDAFRHPYAYAASRLSDERSDELLLSRLEGREGRSRDVGVHPRRRSRG